MIWSVDIAECLTSTGSSNTAEETTECFHDENRCDVLSQSQSDEGDNKASVCSNIYDSSNNELAERGQE